MDLETATYDQIVAELKKRYPQGVVLCQKPDKDKAVDNDEVDWSYWGGKAAAVGVCHIMRAKLTGDILAGLEDEPDEKTQDEAE